MKTTRFATRLVFAFTALAASSAWAGPTCTQEAKEKWMTEAAMQDKIKADGYVIDKFKVTKGNCYEIYGKDKNGKKVEIYFNPVDGSIVKQH